MEASCVKFGLDIFQTLTKDDFDKNIIYSPLSVYMALGMTLYGAQGDTSAEMMKTLHWDSKNANSFHQQLSDCMKIGHIDNTETGNIKIANKLFLEKTCALLDAYIQGVGALYSGAIDKKDFRGQHDKSREEINHWVEQQTNGKIRDLIAPSNVHPLTRLILVNAIYFKGSWINNFSVVGPRDFHLLNGKVKPTEMMTKTTRYKFLKNAKLGFSAVQIPFKTIQNSEYSLLIILPNEKSSLPALERSILQHEWKSILGDQLWAPLSVCITMPKFRIECSFSLSDKLKELGMVKSFTPEADFSLMTGSRDLMIDEVVHKAFIDIDENGAEAAAATAVMMMAFCAMIEPQDPIEFTCDHPFMFALVKAGSLPLFVGHFTQG